MELESGVGGFDRSRESSIILFCVVRSRSLFKRKGRYVAIKGIHPLNRRRGLHTAQYACAFQLKQLNSFNMLVGAFYSPWQKSLNNNNRTKQTVHNKYGLQCPTLLLCFANGYRSVTSKATVFLDLISLLLLLSTSASLKNVQLDTNDVSEWSVRNIKRQ